MATRRIPNALAAALAVLGLCRHGFAGAGAVGLALLAAGGALALGYLALRRLLRGPAGKARGGGLLRRLLRRERRRILRGGPLPYGVAIAAGGLFVRAAPGG